MKPSSEPLLPHNDLAEKGLLGCCILDGSNIVKAIESGIKPDSFFDGRHRDLWGHLRMMEANGHPIDFQTLTQFIMQTGGMEGIGGVTYIMDCITEAPVASNVDFHIKLVAEKWVWRKVVIAAEEAIQKSRDGNISAVVAIGELDQKLSDASLKQNSTVTSARDFALGWIDHVEQRQRDRQAGRQFTGIASGFGRLDRISSGLPLGGLTVIGARPSIGKTALMCCIVYNACILGGTPTTVVSLETTHKTLADRISSNACGIAAKKFRDGDDLSEWEMVAMRNHGAKTANAPLRLSNDLFDCDGICSMIERHAEMETKLFLIDYIQIISAAAKAERKAYSVGSVATALKQTALRCNVAVVALAQLKRNDNEATPPTANDLADSDQIFRDADLLWLLHRPDRFQKPEEGLVCVAKNKEGDCDLVNMLYTPKYLRWQERQP